MKRIKDFTIIQIDELLTLALEYASTHWYLIDDVDIEEPENFTRNEEIEYDFLDKVYQGSNLEIYDLENQDLKLGDLNIASIEQAIDELKKNYQPEYFNILAGYIDEEEADLFLQLCVLGELMYL